MIIIMIIIIIIIVIIMMMMMMINSIVFGYAILMKSNVVAHLIGVKLQEKIR